MRRAIGCGVACVLLLIACDPDGFVDSAVSVSGGAERIRVTGWAWDPNAAGTPVTVSIEVDGVVRGSATANRLRPDVAKVRPEAGPRTGFDITVSTTPGRHRVCAIARNIAGTDGSDKVLDSCATVTVAASPLPRITGFSVSSTSGPAPHTVLVDWDVSTPSSSSPTCRINWDGGGWDETVSNCDDITRRSHTYATAGTRTIRLELRDNVHSAVTRSQSVSVTTQSQEPFNIENRYTGVSAAQQAAIEQGADRWEAVIPVGVPAVTVTVDDEEFCDGASAPQDESIDDLVIDIRTEAVDGARGILASAGPCLIRGDSGLTAYGILIIDSADIEDSLLAGELDDIAAHEIGHVLGIGASDDWYNNSFGIGTSDPRYLGDYAWSRSSDPLGIAVENVGGLGSADSHWRETRYGDELMTSQIDDVNWLSTLSIGALADIGYRVDFNAVEPHPGPALRAADDHDHDHDHADEPFEVVLRDRQREV